MGGALFSRAFDVDWDQHPSVFERLCHVYHLTDKEKAGFLSLSLRAGSLAFYNNTTRVRFFSYSALIPAFAEWYDSPT